MKRMNVLKWIGMICFTLLLGSNAQAQDLKSILGGVINAVTNGKDVTGTRTLEGNWTYVGPDCKFESDNLLAKAGGEVASKKVEDKMSDIMQKLGFTDGCTFTFNSDGSYQSVAKGRTTKGTYTYDNETNELQMKTRLGAKFNATVSWGAGKKMSLLFNVDKLMSLAQTIGNTVGKNSSALSAANSLLGQYDGLQMGFEMEKQ
ncbi:DUF4923 family protein [uncultured Bacteroides sp.]|uniref:DUF4923 family protein n=1 Tax=uncultured Bacteroides sp. TaxID=162156 RepID=UPI00260A8881|nr:DUF4923 family protein [uncultured Bacteroides sp.]